MFVLTQLINSTLKINHIFKKSNPHFINWMAGSISNFTHIDTGVVNGVVTTVYNQRGFVFLYKYNYLQFREGFKKKSDIYHLGGVSEGQLSLSIFFLFLMP